MRKTLYVIFLLAFIERPAASEPLNLQKKVAVNLTSQIGYRVDAENRFTAEELIQAGSDRFKYDLKQDFNLGFTDATVWFRLHVKGEAEEKQRYRLTADFAPLDELVIHSYIISEKPEQGGYIPAGVQTSGDRMRQSEWPVRSHIPVFEFSLSPGEEKVLLLKVKSSSAFVVPLKLYDIDSYYHAQNSYDAFSAVFVGIVLVMFLYNGFLYISLRENVYLYYIAYILLFGFYMMIYTGYAYELIWPGWPRLNNFMNPVMLALTSWSAVSFTRYYLLTERYTPRLDRYLHYTALVFLPLIPLTFLFDYTLMIRIINIAMMAGGVFMIAAGVSAYRAKNQLGLYYLIAFSGFILAAILVVIRNLNIIGGDYITASIIQLGGMAEVVLLSLGLAHRIRILRTEKEEHRERIEDLISDFEMAKGVQSFLLPPELPPELPVHVKNMYMPTRSVGGDYYDYHLIKGRGAGFIIADVTGHGVAAALYSSMFKLAFAQTAPLAKEPDRLVRELNQILNSKLYNHLITLCYVYCDFENREVRLANAGHPAVFYYSPRRKLLESLNPKGRALGLLADIEVEVVKRPFIDNDRIFMYSDGLTETWNLSDEMFGEERLIDFIIATADYSAEKFSADLEKYVLEFSEGRHLEDDISWALITADKK